MFLQSPNTLLPQSDATVTLPTPSLAFALIPRPRISLWIFTPQGKLYLLFEFGNIFGDDIIVIVGLFIDMIANQGISVLCLEMLY